MKSMITKSALVLVTLLAATQCWAGWGAIACSNNNGACTWSQNAWDYSTAVNEALNRCNMEYGNCTLRNWEHNACISEVASNGNVARACY